jgi:hypothetical protein
MTRMQACYACFVVCTTHGTHQHFMMSMVCMLCDTHEGSINARKQTPSTHLSWPNRLPLVSLLVVQCMSFLRMHTRRWASAPAHSSPPTSACGPVLAAWVVFQTSEEPQPPGTMAAAPSAAATQSLCSVAVAAAVGATEQGSLFFWCASEQQNGTVHNGGNSGAQAYQL